MKDVKKTCGMCLGLDTPYYGKTCRERLGKKEKSKICKDFASKPMEFDDIKNGDGFLERLNIKVESGFYDTDKTLLDELNLYYLASLRDGKDDIRKIPTSFKNRSSVRQLVALFEENQAYKDRVVQIQVASLIKAKKLRRIKSAAEAYLYKTYGTLLSNLKSEAMRRTVMDDILEKISKKIDELEILTETSDLVKENLTNTHFVLTNIKDLAEYLFKEKISV